jgi:hypothetical protein
MKHKRLLFITGTLFVLAVLIRLFASSPEKVERSYSNGIYPPIAAVLRAVFGWLPFSFGDILYGALFVFIIWRVVRGIRALIKKRVNWRSFGWGLVKFMAILLGIYVIFNLGWGINYNRQGIAVQLQLKMEQYSKADLEQINGLLVEKVNAARNYLASNNQAYPTNKELFNRVQKAYASVDSVYPFLRYHTTSIKPSLWGWLGNYTGFTGYYNPFTGEAQVNTTVPKFLQPFICCHEVAHQLGYAKEMEANFVGYLAASASHDSLFHYSVYLDLFTYSNRNLFSIDTGAARKYSNALSAAVKTDINEWRNFVRRHSNPFEPAIRWAYGKYLQSNNQPQGVLAYDEVTSFLIAYFKKFGRI